MCAPSVAAHASSSSRFAFAFAFAIARIGVRGVARTLDAARGVTAWRKPWDWAPPAMDLADFKPVNSTVCAMSYAARRRQSRVVRARASARERVAIARIAPMRRVAPMRVARDRDRRGARRCT